LKKLGFVGRHLSVFDSAPIQQSGAFRSDDHNLALLVAADEAVIPVNGPLASMRPVHVTSSRAHQ
jgi:hypothetical protein